MKNILFLKKKLNNSDWEVVQLKEEQKEETIFSGKLCDCRAYIYFKEKNMISER